MTHLISTNKPITGTMVWYYHICKRELWLMSRELAPDEDDPKLEVGRSIHAIFYRREVKEISLDGAKIDFIRGNKEVCEVKTSSKYVEAARSQVLYYLLRLKEMGMTASGRILVPKERKSFRVFLNETSEKEIISTLNEIKNIVGLKQPPPPTRVRYCRKCAYKEFCWV